MASLNIYSSSLLFYFIYVNAVLTCEDIKGKRTKSLSDFDFLQSYPHKHRPQVQVSHVFFMKYYRMGPLQNAQNHELESKRTRCYVEAKYFCHIKYEGNQFRYVAHEIIQLSSVSLCLDLHVHFLLSPLCPQFPSLILMHSLLAYDLKSSGNESINLESRLL